MLHGSETMFKTLFNKMNEELEKGIDLHSRRQDNHEHSCLWASLPQFVQDTSIILA